MLFPFECSRHKSILFTCTKQELHVYALAGVAYRMARRLSVCQHVLECQKAKC